MTPQLDTYEQALLDSLREVVAERSPRHAPRRPSRRALALAGGLVAATTTAVLVVPGLGAEPAYAVSEGSNGALEVRVNRLEDAAGLERELRERGVDAVVNYVPDGGQCRRPGLVETDASGITLSVGDETFGVELEAGAVAAGETLVIDASMQRLPDAVSPEGYRETDRAEVWVSFEVATGSVPECVPV
ncbi:hypothetical protein [Nocardioides perillae]|uniref:Uncharacterized protein n=1 Tax=Nocardioides perillae TaxID=1119534 RepID=A0A7Y9RWQ1_9ACTN|nr:hypothetical protein [Nocardioides perillae]NYG56704.1 hypothetical protein [Nocardioides perillae]